MLCLRNMYGDMEARSTSEMFGSYLGHIADPNMPH